MKDAYSFDRDEAGLDGELRKTCWRPTTGSSTAPGLRWYRVESDVGMMGGSGAHEYMAPCQPARTRSRWPRATPPTWRLRARLAQPVELPGALGAPEEVATPGQTTVEEVSGVLGVAPGALIKAMPLVVEGRGLVLALIRGDHRLNDVKTRAALGADFRPAREEEIEAELGPVGFIGPAGAKVPVIKDRRDRRRGLRHRREQARRTLAGRAARP